MPVVKVEVDRFLTLAVQGIAMTIRNDGINKHSRLISHIEAERGDIHGYGNTDVVWIDLRQNAFLLCILYGSRAR